MKKSDVDDVEFQLKRLLSKYAEFLAYHQWPSEHERWLELVFVLVLRTSGKPESEVRETVEGLGALDLLDVEDLAAIPEAAGNIDYDCPLARRIREYLCEDRPTEEGDKRPGLSDDESKASLLAIHEAASSLIQHHDGKIQRYLRHYGEMMLDELSEHFSFSDIADEDIRSSFAYWLQNVANMPVNSGGKSMEVFCAKYGATLESLTQSADKLDMNVALLDDLIGEYMAEVEA